MSILKIPSPWRRRLAASGAAFLCLGGVAQAAPSYEALMSYTPARSAVQFDSEASVEVDHVITPEMQAVWM